MSIITNVIHIDIIYTHDNNYTVRYILFVVSQIHIFYVIVLIDRQLHVKICIIIYTYSNFYILMYVVLYKLKNTEVTTTYIGYVEIINIIVTYIYINNVKGMIYDHEYFNGLMRLELYDVHKLTYFKYCKLGAY